MSLFHKKKKAVTIQCPVSGEIIPAEEIEDEAFSTGMLGFTVGVRPTEGIVYSPADGTVTTLYDALHAIGITTPEGVEILIHVGSDTVSLQGEHFTSHIKEGAEVKAGDILLGFDIPAIQAAGYLVTTAVIITNTQELGEIKAENGVKIHGDSLLTVRFN